MKKLVETLEAFKEQARQEKNGLSKYDRRKKSLSYFHGKLAGIELALEKIRELLREAK